MIIDVTGIELTPGNKGNDCLGNGKHFCDDGSPIECCCDECDYMQCCFPVSSPNEYNTCNYSLCLSNKKSDTLK